MLRALSRLPATTPERPCVTWTVPDARNGSTISGYEIQKSDDNGATWTACDPNRSGDSRDKPARGRPHQREGYVHLPGRSDQQRRPKRTSPNPMR